MTAIKITDLSESTTPQPDDVVPMVDVGSGVTKKTKLKSLVGSFLPTGGMMEFAGSAAPAGWLLCDGSEVSRTTYADLFDVIAETYGAGDGSTTFEVPDMRGRVAVGKSGESEFNALGVTGGTKTETLTVSQIPSHGHDLYRLFMPQGTGSLVLNDRNLDALLATDNAVEGVNGEAHGPDGEATAQPTGGGGSHNNLQPYFTINHIIKA